VDLRLEVENNIKKIYGKEIELTSKSLERIVKAEEIIKITEEENELLIKKIKENELSISFFANDKKIGITRKSIYLDKHLLNYLNFRIKEKKDYFNLNRIRYLDDKYDELELNYNKLLDNIIDNFDIKMQVEDYKKTINDLLEENKALKDIVKDKQRDVMRLNNELKSYKIIKLK